MTSTVGQMPVPAIEASTSRKITGGSVITRSTKRMATASAQRPASAEIAPKRKPMTAEMSGRGYRDQQRNAAAFEHAGKDVAADAVGAEPMGRRRAAVHGEKVDVVRLECPPQRIGQDQREHRQMMQTPNSAARLCTKRWNARAIGPGLREGMRASISTHLDARVDDRIGDVGQKIDDDHAGADDQRRAHDDRIVARLDGIRPATDPCPAS